MRAVKGRDTKPEIVVRKLLHALGYRFRLHRGDVPGTPDIVFLGRRKAVFVNGCFWHGHECRRGARKPKANAAYWEAKIERNKVRDQRVRADLEALGWRSETIWECELGDLSAVRERLVQFLGDTRRGVRKR
ncbi:MAG: very short patch repair endonuclease [Hyphomicrobiales bacterium]|nr:very short patch repair endonuclease [Hyphomicrobiales bacterium]